MIRRRRLLGTVVAAAVVPVTIAGCESDDAGRPKDATEPNREPPEPDPDLPLLAELITAEEGIVSAYEATIRKFPALRDRLRPYADHHREHRDALRAANRAAGGGPTPTSTSTSKSTSVTVPKSREAAVRALREHERSAASARTKDLENASGGPLARLVAAIAASETLHADALEA